MIVGRPSRIAVVGATSLAGKELSEALGESPLDSSDVVLLDAEDAVGQMTTAGDEVTFIQKIDEDSFGESILFSSPAMRRRHGSTGSRHGWRVRALST